MKNKIIRSLFKIQFVLSCLLFAHSVSSADLWADAVGREITSSSTGTTQYTAGWLDKQSINDTSLTLSTTKKAPKLGGTTYERLASYSSTQVIISRAAYLSALAKVNTDANGVKSFATIDDLIDALHDWPNFLDQTLDEYGTVASHNVPTAAQNDNKTHVKALFSLMFGPKEADATYKNSALDVEMDHIPSQEYSGSPKAQNNAAYMMVAPTLTETHRGFEPDQFGQGVTVPTDRNDYYIHTSNKTTNQAIIGSRMDGDETKLAITSNGTKKKLVTGSNYLDDAINVINANNPTNQLTAAEEKQIRSAYRAAINVVDAKRAARETADFIINNNHLLDENNTNVNYMDRIADSQFSQASIEEAQKEVDRAMVMLSSYNNKSGNIRTATNLNLGEMTPLTRDLINNMAHNDVFPASYSARFKSIIVTLRADVQKQLGILDCS